MRAGFKTSKLKFALILFIFAAVSANAMLGLKAKFASHGPKFVQRTELVPSSLAQGQGSEFAQFGESVAISGSTIVVGAPRAQLGGNSHGAVYVYAWNGMTAKQRVEFTSSDGADGDGFGTSVAVSRSVVLSGAPSKASSANGGARIGASYFFW